MSKVASFTIGFETEGNVHIIDITDKVKECVRTAGIRDGIVLVFAKGATGAISTIEYEPGVLRDMEELMERLIPEKGAYHHDSHLDGGNAHSHLRASLFGPSESFPLRDGEMVLGTWQQIAFIDFDNRPRRREVLVQIVGGEADE